MGTDGPRNARLLPGGSRVLSALKVLLDATSLPPQRLGAARYILGLVTELAVLDEVELHVLTKRRDTDDLRAIAPRATLHTAGHRRRPTRLVWEQTVLPVRLRRLSPAVYHGPHYTMPASVSCPVVVTFHDPTFFTNPELHERAKVAYFRRMSRLAAKRASRVIADSDYSRRGAVEYAGADPARTDVVHLGVDLTVYRPCVIEREQDADARIRKRLGVRAPYLFWVGAIEPRKDVPTLVRAFAKLPPDLQLVLGGMRAWGADEVDDAVERSGAAERILRPGYISEPEKVALYRGAKALVYPSIAEGFGMQVLEAMACGCPVVTTTGSAPEEVGGEAVSLVPARDPDALREATERVLADDDHARRLRDLGRSRAAKFTWSATAIATVAAYRRALT